MPRKLGLIAVLFALTACGGTVSKDTAASPSAPSASPTASPSPTGPNVGGCFTEADGGIFSYGDGYTGVIMGTGPVGAVVSYERGGDVCAWRPLADRLKAAGYRVLLYDRSGAAAFGEDLIVEMAGRLRKEGVKRLFLVGGSIGGHMSIVAATRLKKPAAAVVSLSGFALAEEVAPLDVPLLQITAENDRSPTPSIVEEVARAAVDSPDRPVVIVRGEGAHASRLFETAQSQMVLDTIMAFLAKHDG
ncbi:hypothetical protein GCM10009555_046860 [Acrocarpospora macrocephala]|uniref:Alpha/beta hydrolase n=1 Tax=Acrocarpospora macrocephala TaxID=150177 RepID=A0A5M3X144_9ACTN|nr:hypothetical protein [Acrocarpospora macrocephala]GES12028.1 hypothetical protein Amac_056250 [Acrocarpospora macrocephala]